jgi:hypothetical protein
LRKGLLIFLAAALFARDARCATARSGNESVAASGAATSQLTMTTPALRATPPKRGTSSASVERNVQSRAAVNRQVNNSRVTETTPALRATPPKRGTSGGASVERNVQSRAAAGGAIVSAIATRRTSGAARSAVAGAGNAAGNRKSMANRSRAAIEGAIEGALSSRVGAAYEQCKNSYFSCMDQFCAVKNEKYRRCSCSDKIFDLDEQQKVLEGAAVQINEFNAGLDAVGMSAAQATAMREASEGELAMGADKSASKRLLNAIMNSISGSGETAVGGGSLEQLNSLSFGTSAGAFGADDAAAISSYNGSALYTAIYGQCRQVVRDNCADDALQRAVTAYLMAVENDCGTVQKMIDDNRNKMSSAARESSAMLSLARIEDRQNRNSMNAAECLDAVEGSIKDDQVCGAGYKKCLDNGEFIDKDTGKPFQGVTDFYKLEKLLTFDEGAGTNIGDAKLAKLGRNKTFVENFVVRNKKFAEGALGKCVEISDTVWGDYLDKAMLEIYYAQKAKVDEIRRGCFDFVRECYVDGKKAVTDFMRGLADVSGANLLPETVSLTSMLCDAYVESCNGMFGGEGGGDIVASYIKNVDDKDILTTCRNVARECFDTYGGVGYNNFYNPGSGLFKIGQAMDWFTLYEYEYEGDAPPGKKVLSACARKLKEISECGDDEKTLEKIFGGFDKIVLKGSHDHCYNYGIKKNSKSTPVCESYSSRNFASVVDMLKIRVAGVATEVYNEIVGRLDANCKNFSGSFVEYRYLNSANYCRHDALASVAPGDTSDETNPCRFIPAPLKNRAFKPCFSTFNRQGSTFSETLKFDYNFTEPEDLCPVGYGDMVDTLSWGICSCWANGGRRMIWTATPGVAQKQTCQVWIPGLASNVLTANPIRTNARGQVCPIHNWKAAEANTALDNTWPHSSDVVPFPDDQNKYKDEQSPTPIPGGIEKWPVGVTVAGVDLYHNSSDPAYSKPAVGGECVCPNQHSHYTSHCATNAQDIRGYGVKTDAP